MTNEEPETRRPGQIIPELSRYIRRYGARLKEQPPYVVTGLYLSPSIGPIMGVLAAAHNEFFAYLLRREINKRGNGKVQRTEYHADRPTFSLELYIQKMRNQAKR